MTNYSVILNWYVKCEIWENAPHVQNVINNIENYTVCMVWKLHGLYGFVQSKAAIEGVLQK